MVLAFVCAYLRVGQKTQKNECYMLLNQQLLL